MSRYILLIIFLVLMPTLTIGQSAQQKGYMPKDGFVPDEKTAVAIAETILIPIYGKEQINSEKPLNAKLKNGIWIVQGSLPEGYDGGVAEVRLSKQDARIIFVEHTK
jgi:hypothetical protein